MMNLLKHLGYFNANQIATLLKNEDLPTPYSIDPHDEWRGGKTSLLYYAYEILRNDLPDDDWKTLWFDAWKYERLDPALALMQRIANEFKTNTKCTTVALVSKSSFIE